jgi:tight adherence protein B
VDYLFYIFATLIFVAVVLLIEGVYLHWNSSKGPEATRVARRLQMMSAGAHVDTKQASIVKDRFLADSPALQRLLAAVPRVHALDRTLHQSGKSWTVAQFFGISAGAFVATFVAAGAIAVPFLIKLGLALAVATVPYTIVLRAKAKRLVRLEQQLPDALDLMGRALRAGHAFPTALKMVGDEMTDPLATEFRNVFDEVNFGVSMPNALMNLAARVPSTDLRYFVIAVLIQRETGGNLSELLANISAIIRARMKLMGQIRVLSAEGRMSAWVLSLLPFGAAALIQLTNPKFLELLHTDSLGQKMLMVTGFMMTMGVLVMRKIIRIRV